MAQQSIRRRQGSANITATSGKQSVTLGRGMILREVILTISGTITYGSAAHNTPSTLGRGDEFSAIDRIDIVVNGTDAIRTFYGWQLKMIQRLLYGSVPRFAPELGDATQTTVQVRTSVIVPIWMPLSFKPMDTALDTSMLQDLRVDIVPNALLGINKTNAPTAFSLTVDVSTAESYGVQLQAADCRMWQISKAAEANSNLQIQLPPNALYRGLLVNVADSGLSTATDKAPYNLVSGAAQGVTNLKVRSGQHVFHDMNMLTQSDWQRQRLGWMDQKVQSVAASAALNLVSPNFLRQVKSALADAEAWTFVDFCQDGYLGEGIDSVGLSELIVEMDCTLAAGIITTIPVAIYPRRKAA